MAWDQVHAYEVELLAFVKRVLRSARTEIISVNESSFVFALQAAVVQY